MQGSLKDCLKQRVSIITKSGSISSLGNVWIRNFEDWALEFFDGTESTIIAKDEIKVLTIRPATEQEGEMLNIPKPEHIPEAPPKGMHDFYVGQYIIYHNSERYELGRIKELTKDGAFVSYTEGSGASLTLFSDMHPLFNHFCIIKTNLGGNFFGNS